MQISQQLAFRANPKAYIRLKENSYYVKELNRGTMDFKKFSENMKTVYKERAVDKINSVVENIDLINSVLNVLK